jgi:hypothetical protein
MILLLGGQSTNLLSSVPFGADRRNEAADGRRRRTEVVIQQAEPMRLIDVLAPIIDTVNYRWIQKQDGFLL